MAKRFTKTTINWVDLEKRVPLNQRAFFFAFKAKSEAYIRRIQANPPRPPKINWEEYQKTVPIPGLVDKFKAAYEAFQVPFPADTFSVQVDEQWKSLEPEIKEFCAKQDKEIESAKKELARIEALPKYEEMTMEMYHDMFPNIAHDSVLRPTFWPHTPDEQEGYKPPEIVAKKSGGH